MIIFKIFISSSWKRPIWTYIAGVKFLYVLSLKPYLCLLQLHQKSLILTAVSFGDKKRLYTRKKIMSLTCNYDTNDRGFSAFV